MDYISETKKNDVTMREKYLTPNEKLWNEIPKKFLTEQNTWRLLNRQEKALLTEGQLYSYERYWMSVVDERILREAACKKAYDEGFKRGFNEGMEKGSIVTEESVEQGRDEQKLKVARDLRRIGVPVYIIAKSLSLSPDEIEHL